MQNKAAAARALLPALVLLAGCLDGGSGPGEGLPEGPEAPVRLAFRPAIDLGSASGPVAAGTNCLDSLADGDCGLGEPQVEVDSRGTVYVSGVCCLTVSPPVYVSRDGGQTFGTLATPNGVREAFGIEGDFAVDGLGRVYFADIELAATFQVTVWDADGNFLRHTKWPAPPMVDRDWVRAEGDGIVYYVYNNAARTLTYKSTDAAATFSPAPIHVTEWNLGTATSGPALGDLWVSGGGGKRRVDFTLDGGATWTVETSTLDSDGDNTPGAIDEGGNYYLAGAPGGKVHVARRGADGQWLEAVAVTAEGSHRLPWIAAGRDGAVAVAWYGTAKGSNEWRLHAAVSTDHGQTWAAQVADPEPVFVGDLARELLDFLQVDLGPDGAVHVAYSKLAPGTGTEEQLTYVRSEPLPQLAALDFANGP